MQAALQKQGRATVISSRSFKRHAVENFAAYRKSDLGLRFTIGLSIEITHGPTQKSILWEANNYAKEGRVGSRDSTELYHQAYTHLFAHRIHLHRASILTLAHHVCKARRGFPTFAARNTVRRTLDKERRASCASMTWLGSAHILLQAIAIRDPGAVATSL